MGFEAIPFERPPEERSPEEMSEGEIPEAGISDGNISEFSPSKDIEIGKNTAGESVNTEVAEPDAYETLSRSEFLDVMKEDESNALERYSSRFKNALLGVTAGVSLMMGAPIFAGAEELRAMTEEKGVSAAEEERSAEELRLARELHGEGYTEKSVEEFLSFARQEGVSFPDLLIVKENKGERSDTLMLLKAYAVAAGAVENGRLSDDMRERFENHVLVHLKNGHVDVVRVAKDDISGAEAVYDGKNDAYMDTDIDLGSIGDRAIAIHELVHLSQDSRELVQQRQDAEHEAYRTGTEYTMSHADVFRTDEDGNTIFTRPVVMEDVRTEYEKLIMYEAALRNAEHGNNALNTITAEGIEFSSLDTQDAIAWYREQARSLREMIDVLWASSTHVSSVISGKMIDTSETIIKNGIMRHKKTQ